METLKARPHHAKILRRLVVGELEPHYIRELYTQLGYPDEQIDVLLNSASKIVNNSAELEIAESGLPDFICHACVEGNNGIALCPNGGYNPDEDSRDNRTLKESGWQIGQKIEF